jgi:hypothetical protein
LNIYKCRVACSMSGGVGVPGFVPRAFFAGREGRRMFALAHGMYATPGTSVGWRVASDSGVSSDRFGEVFERLFTTKGQAIGMPLSVRCTIVETYVGWIRTESQVEGNTGFRLLPPAKTN